MRIAIIGSGFAGIATAWHLKSHEVTVFDPAGIGGGASGIAAGLLHPFAGAHAKLNWKGREGLEATLKLLEASSKAIGEPVAANTGLLRLPFSEQQNQDFTLAAEKYPEIKSAQEGIFITTAWTVDCKKYLEGLFKDCPHGIFVKEAVYDLGTLKEYDAVIIAMGISSRDFSTEKLHPIKGQLLELEWPSGLKPLSFPISSEVYIVPNKNSCIVGATFEKGTDSPLPDLKTALEILKPKYTRLIPELGDAKVIDCRAAIRAAAPNHTPIVKRLNPRTWIIAGLGSKGLLHHAILAEELSSSLTHAIQQQS